MKAPAFQFYPADWMASQRLQMLSLEEEGAYIRLLCYCWNHGSIPADPEKLARLIGKGGSTTLARVVATMFQPDGSNPEIMRHERLDLEREKQAQWKEKSSAGGKKSAEIREKNRNNKGKAAEKSPVNPEDFKGGSRVVEPPLVGCLENGINQTPTLQSSSSASAEDIKKSSGGAPCTVDEAWSHAQSRMSPITKEGVHLWHDKRGAANWTIQHNNGNTTAINAANWKQDLTGSHSWIRADLAKAQAAEARAKPFPGKQTEIAQRRAERAGPEKLNIEYS